jgi:hypothetical protein
MKVVLYILGGLFTLVGVVWILQGLNVLLGSAMSGHIQYAILGLVVAVIGIVLLVFAGRRGRAAGRSDTTHLPR